MNRTIFFATFGFCAASAVVGCVNDSTDAPRLAFDASPPLGLDGGRADAAEEQPDAAPDAITPSDDASTADVGADAGPAQIVTSAAVIDFGDVSCGEAGAVKTFSFTNTGGAVLHYDASVAGPFALEGSAAGDVAVAASGTLSLKTQAVPTTATAGLALEGSLTVTTNDPTLPTVTIPLKVTPQGGVVSLAPASAGFGEVLAGSDAADVPLVVSNSGTRPITVAFGAPSAGDFVLEWTGAPAAATLAPGASLAGAKARFHPSSVGVKSAAAAIVTTGALCGGSATELVLEGQGTSLPVAVGPAPLDFGIVDCGTTAAAKDVTIDNPNAFAVTYDAKLALANASPYAIAPSSGTIAAKSKATVKVTPKKIAAPASVATGAFNDTLTITTDAPNDAAHVVPLQQSARGAVLALTMAQTDFGNVDVLASKSLPLSVKNSGNASVSVTLTASGSGFAVTPAGAHTLAASGGMQAYDATFTPSAIGAANGAIAIATSSGPVCSASIAPTNMTGTGVAAIATLSSSTVALSATCGSGAPSSTLTIKNTGNKTLTMANWTLPAPFTLGATPSTLAPNAQATVTIGAPAAVVGTDAGGSSQSAELSFTTNETGNPTRKATITKNTVGANLFYSLDQVNPTSWIAFFMQCNGSVPPESLYVVNTGNASVTVNPAAVPPSGMMTWTAAANQVTPAGGKALFTCYGQEGNDNSPLNPATITGPVCMPLQPITAATYDGCLPP